MRCAGCNYYKTGFMYNACSLTESECFMPMEDCDLVNDDGSINFKADYFANSVEEAGELL